MRGYRTKVGKHFNEGARLMWLLLGEKKWNTEDLARVCGWSRSVSYRYIWGDRRPEYDQLMIIEKKLGIDPRLFHVNPKRRFVAATARAAA